MKLELQKSHVILENISAALCESDFHGEMARLEFWPKSIKRILRTDDLINAQGSKTSLITWPGQPDGAMEINGRTSQNPDAPNLRTSQNIEEKICGRKKTKLKGKVGG